MIASPKLDQASVTSVEKRDSSFCGADLTSEGSETHLLTLLAEEVAVSRRKIDNGMVRITTVTQSRDEEITEELTHERVDIKHVLIGRYVDAVPPVREDGDLTIMSVVEEVLVVERRLLLREEIHVRRSHITETHTQTVSLRKQEAVITRHPPETQIVEDGPFFTNPRA